MYQVLCLQVQVKYQVLLVCRATALGNVYTVGEDRTCVVREICSPTDRQTDRRTETLMACCHVYVELIADVFRQVRRRLFADEELQENTSFFASTATDDQQQRTEVRCPVRAVTLLGSVSLTFFYFILFNTFTVAQNTQSASQTTVL